MQSQSNVCLLCRHALKSSNRLQTRIGRRWASSKPIRHIYTLPRVVVDLDAMDSKIVRKLEDIPEKEQLASWQPQRKSIRVESVRGLPHEGDGKSNNSMETIRWHGWTGKEPSIVRKEKRTTSRSIGGRRAMEIQLPSQNSGFNSMTTSAPDLLMYALLGEPVASHTPRNTFLRQLLHSNGLMATESTEDKLRQLALQFAPDPSTNAVQAGFTLESEDLIEQEIVTGAWTFPEVQRLVAILSPTAQGCQFLAHNGAEIVSLIRLCRSTSLRKRPNPHKITLTMVLRLLNDLVLNIDSKGLDPGADLCHTGLYYASRCGNLSAVKTYLEISRKNNHSPDWKVVRALKALLVNVSKGLELPNPWPPWKGANGHHSEIMNFVRDWRGETKVKHSKQGSIWGPDFGMAFTGDSSTERSYLYVTYLFGLGEMRSKDTLRAEWELVKASIPAADYLQHAQVFAIAFMLARDPAQAFELLKTIPEGGMTTTGDKLKSSALAYLISYHYSFHNIIPSSAFKATLVQRTSEIWYFKDRPEYVLQILEALLLIGFPKQLPEKSLEVNFTSVDDTIGHGLLVSSFFKEKGKGFKVKE